MVVSPWHMDWWVWGKIGLFSEYIVPSFALIYIVIFHISPLESVRNALSSSTINSVSLTLTTTRSLFTEHLFLGFLMLFAEAACQVIFVLALLVGCDW